MGSIFVEVTIAIIPYIMKILHTSDWHLGQTLHFQSRDEEHSLFLDWLYTIIVKENIECLIHSGDVFDVGNPSNSSRELYFTFLSKLQSTHCTTTIIIAGNHDSPMMLQHSASLLANLQIFVITTAQNLQEPIEIKNSLGEVKAICYPIPYLRDQDLMLYKQDEDIDETKKRLRNAIESYYIQAFTTTQQNNIQNVPIILTGHLVAHKGELTESQSERPIHRQNFGELHTANLPSGISYVALGHLHKPQQINGGVLTRYAGSPIPLSFQEVSYKHSVTIVEINGNTLQTEQIPIPRFRLLLRISICNFLEFEQSLQKQVDMSTTLSPTWIECECVDFLATDSLKIDLQTIAQNYNAVIVKFVYTITDTKIQSSTSIHQKDIGSFTDEEMFLLALEQNGNSLNEEDQKDVFETFLEALEQFQEKNMEGKQ